MLITWRRFVLPIALTIGLGAMATPAEASLPTLYTQTLPHKFAVKPPEIVIVQDGGRVLGGPDGTSRGHFGHMKWSRWTSSEGLGSGALWIDNCQPSCASGTYSAHAVTAKAFDPRSGHFTRLTLHYGLQDQNVTERLGIKKSFSGSYFYYGISTTSVPQPGGCSLPPKPRASPTPAPALAFPLHTQGRHIFDHRGRQVRLAAVNWYGAEEKDFVVSGLDCRPLDQIAKQIRALGFNAVRLPWSNQMLETNPRISSTRVRANKQLRGRRALSVFQTVVQTLARHHLAVILDDHMSNANWCCSNNDHNGLWSSRYLDRRWPGSRRYGTARWLTDWRRMARLFAGTRSVIGADLRNEPRNDGEAGPNWGGGGPRDWLAAVQQGGNTVLGVAPNWLIFVEGLSFATDLTGVYSHPAQLHVPNRLVYSAHDYSFSHSNDGCLSRGYASLWQCLGNRWGFILQSGQPYTAPVWVGEFGTCHTQPICISNPGTGDPPPAGPAFDGYWFTNFVRYLTDGDIDWSYWAINGTAARGDTWNSSSARPDSCGGRECRLTSTEETYGIFGPSWTWTAASPVTALYGIER